MQDLIEFQRLRILALMNEVDRLKKVEQQLNEYILELCDVDCPREYKRVIRREILSNYE
jgi:hypothetical protein